MLVYQRVIVITLSATESDIIPESSPAPATEDGVGHEDISTSDVRLEDNRTKKNIRIHLPICSMYGIFTYIWRIYGVNVGKYSIHGAYGLTSSNQQNNRISIYFHIHHLTVAIHLFCLDTVSYKQSNYIWKITIFNGKINYFYGHFQ